VSLTKLLKINSLIFVDDLLLLVSCGQDLQHALDRFAAACDQAGNTNIITKTLVLYYISRETQVSAR